MATLPELFILSIFYLKLTTQAVHIYTNKIAILLKNSMLINVNWKIIKTIKLKSPTAIWVGKFFE